MLRPSNGLFASPSPRTTAYSLDQPDDETEFRERWIRGDLTTVMAIRFAMPIGSISRRAAELGLPPRKLRRTQDALLPPSIEAVRLAVAAYVPPRLGPVKTCQFPMWGLSTPQADRRFCGSAVDGSSYCAGHRAVCYTARMPMRAVGAGL